MFLGTDIFENSNCLCVVVVVVVVVVDVVAAAAASQKKISLWQSPRAWMKKITSVFYNTLKFDELKYNAIASLF
jgi:hypothetical protein